MEHRGSSVQHHPQLIRCLGGRPKLKPVRDNHLRGIPPKAKLAPDTPFDRWLAKNHMFASAREACIAEAAWDEALQVMVQELEKEFFDGRTPGVGAIREAYIALKSRNNRSRK